MSNLVVDTVCDRMRSLHSGCDKQQQARSPQQMTMFVPLKDGEEHRQAAAAADLHATGPSSRSPFSSATAMEGGLIKALTQFSCAVDTALDCEYRHVTGNNTMVNFDHFRPDMFHS